MDLSEIKAKTKDLHITHPGTGLPLGWVFELVFPGHPRIIAAETQHGKRVHKRNGDLDVKAQRTLMIEISAASVENWRFENEDGTPSKFTIRGDKPSFDRDMLRGYFEDAQYGWLREQIAAAYEDRSDFFPASPVNSKASAKS
ncbi:MAG: hypothetical protein GC208_09735 [Alphaproteobacteria bacterium]|nr:hypothetical protein [Alphaproteobacteria bacterium]